MRKSTILFCLTSILFCQLQISFGQFYQIKEQSLATGKPITISIVGSKKDAATPTRPQYIKLYKRNAQNLLLGNRCAEEAMQYYGVEFVIVAKQNPIGKLRYRWHNFKANTRLFFRNGFFWKTRLQKKIDKCKDDSHDFVR
ncbi:MAG: hypothetical protein NZ551_04120 [Microscillaceae bacterium]|nr:hypothetical protein [Microscillaceae bacterium]MDW8460377.1 hypothetical protein [Cytophagales bacterium]